MSPARRRRRPARWEVREGRKSGNEVCCFPGAFPEVRGRQLGGVGGTIEEMGRGMREEVAFCTNIVIGPAETCFKVV